MTAMPTPEMIERALLDRFYKLAAKEDYPRSKAITEELDQLQAAIRKMREEKEVAA